MTQATAQIQHEYSTNPDLYSTALLLIECQLQGAGLRRAIASGGAVAHATQYGFIYCKAEPTAVAS